jgi:DNA-binding transcriptional LysR family regulator
MRWKPSWASRKNEGLAGTIHVGSTSGFTKLLLPGLAPLSQYGICLDLQSAPPPALVKALADRELDLAVTPARIPHKAIDYDLLYEGPLMLVCAPRWRERLPKSAAPKGLPLIELQGPMPVLGSFWRAAFGSNPDLPSAIVPDYQAAVDAAAAGTGLAVVPECFCTDMLQTGQLISQNIRAKSQVSIYVARSKANIAVDRVRITHQLLAEAARGW